jgi:SAM-dependent methyltransferase
MLRKCNRLLLIFIIKNLFFFFRTSVIKNIYKKYLFIFESSKEFNLEIFTLKLLKRLIISEIIIKKICPKIIKKNKLNTQKFDYDDWFSHNIPIWKYFIKKNILNKKIKYLEIGCFEGRSTIFIAENFKDSQIEIVDNFKGGNEHNNIEFHQVYINFKRNINSFKKRVKINKIDSKTFYKKNKKKYDLIYVDGSHYYKDVVLDFNECFKILNVNGIIIFDDFLWKYYKDINQNPIGALLPLLKKNYKNFIILHVGYQIILKKKRNNYTI